MDEQEDELEEEDELETQMTDGYMKLWNETTWSNTIIAGNKG